MKFPCLGRLKGVGLGHATWILSLKPYGGAMSCGTLHLQDECPRMTSRNLLLSLLLLVGRARAHPERAYIVFSEASDYSPVLRMTISVDTTKESVLVSIDSGSLRAHGTARSSGAVMRHMTLEGIVAAKPAPSGTPDERLRRWVPAASSTTVTLAAVTRSPATSAWLMVESYLPLSGQGGFEYSRAASAILLAQSTRTGQRS